MSLCVYVCTCVCMVKRERRMQIIEKGTLKEKDRKTE